jgi:hypothetical protein
MRTVMLPTLMVGARRSRTAGKGSVSDCGESGRFYAENSGEPRSVAEICKAALHPMLDWAHFDGRPAQPGPELDG